MNVYIVQTPVHDINHCDQRLEAVPQWHMGKYITKCHRLSSWPMEKAVMCKHEGQKYITLIICETETCSFQNQHTTQLALFTATNSLLRATNSLLRKTCCFTLFPLQLFKSKLQINMHHLPKAMQYRQAHWAFLMKICFFYRFLRFLNFNIIGIEIRAEVAENRENFDFLVQISLKRQIPLSNFFYKIKGGEGVQGP